ncbi:EamA family transporter [Cytophagaceae bacterium YF14B1]|uniref:EamA family transporter n=1 Tax=Xanthocytophaga flava TaxID=3048013 RepID=A0AAE3QJ42_9BACT|nr:EamA family transporter [Xanthocytophaga flavus]MDJ1479571.1 EamA family transporter [Xanthocytophaga flavus]
MTSASSTPRWLIILAFFNIYVIWGSTYLAVRFGLQGFPPFILSGIRYLTAGILLYLISRARKEEQPDGRSIRINVISGMLMLVGGSGMVAWAEQYITSGQAAILIATEPFWFLLLDKKRWSFYFANKSIIAGLLIGFVGIILFFQWQDQTQLATSSSQYAFIASLVVLVSAVFWVIGSLYSKTNAFSASVIANAGIQLFAAGIGCFLLSTLTHEWSTFAIRNVSWQAWSGLLFLIFMGSLAAYLSFVWLITFLPPALVSTHTYVNPVVAVLFGWILANETLSLLQLLALVVILIGILLINLPSYRSIRTTKAK